MSAYRTIAGSDEQIDALIMTAALCNLWAQVSDVVVVHEWAPDRKVMYRRTGATPDELHAWNGIIELSKNFKVSYVE